jgi:hypothetical protein
LDRDALQASTLRAIIAAARRSAIATLTKAAL